MKESFPSSMYQLACCASLRSGCTVHSAFVMIRKWDYTSRFMYTLLGDNVCKGVIGFSARLNNLIMLIVDKERSRKTRCTDLAQPTINVKRRSEDFVVSFRLLGKNLLAKCVILANRNRMCHYTGLTAGILSKMINLYCVFPFLLNHLHHDSNM